MLGYNNHVSRWLKSALCLALAWTTFGTDCDTVPTVPGVIPPGTIGSNFNNATPVTLDANDSAKFSGNIAGDKVDVYDLGAVAPGDRIIVSVDPATGSTLDPTIAIFDENGELYALNDDVDLAGGLLGSAIDDVVHQPSTGFFLAITKFFFDNAGGAYEADVRIERGGTVPTPPIQVLLLDFDGGAFTINNEGAFNLDPFDASDIDPAYVGKTTEIKDRIAVVVRENFEDTGLTVVTTDENPSLTPGTFSVVYFGAFSATKFGVADSVDQGNFDRCDDAIVFTENFDNPFATQPSVVGIATAIANVAAHEAGHLLGLNHVSDITALMDNTGSASTILADQDFKTSTLSPSVFSIGMQNAPALLDRVVPVP